MYNFMFMFNKGLNLHFNFFMQIKLMNKWKLLFHSFILKEND